MDPQIFFDSVSNTEAADTKIDESQLVKSDETSEVVSKDGRQTGRVVRWSHRGFGFIAPKDGAEDVFVHFSALREGNALEEGSDVEFTKIYDEAKSKYFAEDVTGGITEDRNAGRGGFSNFNRGGNNGGRGKGPCFAYRDGNCHYGNSCKFSHGDGDNRQTFSNFGGRRPRGMCYDFEEGRCSRGSACRFSHGDQDSARGMGGYNAPKSRVCYSYQNGDCKYGETCKFDHIDA